MAKLAIHGGKKVLPEGQLGMDNVSYVKETWPIITDKEKKAVMEVLDSGVLMGAFAPQVGGVPTLICHPANGPSHLSILASTNPPEPTEAGAWAGLK